MNKIIQFEQGLTDIQWSFGRDKREMIQLKLYQVRQFNLKANFKPRKQSRSRKTME